MLRVTAGMSRQLARGPEIIGFSLHVDGQIALPLDQPEAVIDKVHEYFDVVREALQDQVDQFQESQCPSAQPTVASEARNAG